MNDRKSNSPAASDILGRPGEIDTSLDRARHLIQFWQELGPEGWFDKNDEVDRRFCDLCCDLHFAAARRECEHWVNDAEGGLALLILLDQFPRNVFRGTGHMFATDPLARHYARRYIDTGLVEHIDPALRLFVCLPFAHSEALDDQNLAVALYQQYAPENLHWAEHHRDIIKRFGRFPHRNASLGRPTTPEEQAFLDGGGFTG